MSGLRPSDPLRGYAPIKILGLRPKKNIELLIFDKLDRGRSSNIFVDDSINIRILELGRSPNIFVYDSINIRILELGRSPNIFVDDSIYFSLLDFWV